MRLPKIWAKCELCDPEYAGHPPEEVAWGPKRQQWLCYECWAEMENIGEEQDLSPLVYAKDALPDGEEQMQRLIVVATRKRMGVKL
jgi:hypothetical protein